VAEDGLVRLEVALPTAHLLYRCAEISPKFCCFFDELLLNFSPKFLRLERKFLKISYFAAFHIAKFSFQIFAIITLK
jgi:hypothetical protein